MNKSQMIKYIIGVLLFISIPVYGFNLCHCPIGQNGHSCFSIDIPQEAINSHIEQHPYDHYDLCDDSEIDSYNPKDNDMGSGTENGFTLPWAGSANWREN